MRLVRAVTVWDWVALLGLVLIAAGSASVPTALDRALVSIGLFLTVGTIVAFLVGRTVAHIRRRENGRDAD